MQYIFLSGYNCSESSSMHTHALFKFGLLCIRKARCPPPTCLSHPPPSASSD